MSFDSVKLYCVWDKKIEAFGFPFCAQNDAVMVRILQGEMIRNPQTLYMSHPQDYAVFCLGEFDRSSGVITGSSLLPENASPVVEMVVVRERLSHGLEEMGHDEQRETVSDR